MLLYKSVKSKTTAGRKFWKTNINVIQCKLHQVKPANKHYSCSQNHKKRSLDIQMFMLFSRTVEVQSERQLQPWNVDLIIPVNE